MGYRERVPIVANVVGYHVLKPGFVNGNGCEVIQAAMLREHLSRLLPPVISPTFLVRLDALPLTSGRVRGIAVPTRAAPRRAHGRWRRATLTSAQASGPPAPPLLVHEVT